MHDRIARTLVRLLAHLPLTRRPHPGRHTAKHLTTPAPSTSASAPTPEPDPDPWRRPWTGPSSAEALAIFRSEEAQALPLEHRERFYATAFAERGYDYLPRSTRLCPHPATPTPGRAA
ncbi:hypothetical protein JNUCC64_12060 [Streptomyces sp. JNUCC 64]